MNFPNRKQHTNIIVENTNSITLDKKNKKPWKANMANKGMGLEEMINTTNEYYLSNDIAIIHKKPIPVQIVKVDYPSRNKAVITEAYYKTPSTTDYNGIYLGKYIDFDAKECSSLTSFPLKNVHPHQVIHLNNIIKHGGIGFLLVSWNKYNEYYILPMEVFNRYYEAALNNSERQSIPYETFKNECFLMKEGYMPRLDYLATIREKYIQNHN